MKKHERKRRLWSWLGLFLAILGANGTQAQSTVTIGLPLAISSSIGPLYMNATQVIPYQRTMFMYQASELAAKGIVSCGTITSLALNKLTTAGTTAGRNITMRIFMRNASSNYSGSSNTWNSAGATLVYQNTTQTLPSAAGFVNFPFSTNFSYTGGNIEVLIEMNVNGSTTGWFGTTINWGMTAGGAGSTAGYLGQTFPSYYLNVSSLPYVTATPSTIGNPRTYVPNIQIGYNAPANVAADLSLVAMTPNATGCWAGYGKTISAVIRNTGTATWNFATDPVEVRGSAAGTNAQIFSPVTVNSGSLAPNANLTITMSNNYDLIDDTTYRFGFSVNAAAGIDQKACNDSATYSRDVLYANGGPFNQDFTGFNGANLNTQLVSNRKWREGTGVTPLSYSSNWATASGMNGTSNNSAAIAMGTPIQVGFADTKRKDWLVGPTFTPSTGDVFQFSAAISDQTSFVVADTMHTDDTVAVMVSTDCGVSWSNLFNITRGQFLSPTFRNYSVPLSAYAGQEIILAIFANDGPTAPTVAESFNANAYYFFVDSIRLVSGSNNDFGITSITIPSTGCNLGASEALSVGISNFSGSSFTGNIPVQYRVNNGSWINTNSFTGTLAGGATSNHTISINLNGVGAKFIEVRTNFASDPNSGNNIGYGSTINIASTALTSTYTQSFEGLSGLLPSGWYTFDEKNDAVILSSGYYANLWQNRTGGTGQFSCNGTNALVVSSDKTVQNEWVFSNCFSMEAGKTYELTFGYKASSVNLWPIQPKVLFGFSNSQNPNSFVFNQDSVSNFTSSCQTYTGYFTATTTGSYFLTFNYNQGNTGGTLYPLNIDDITLRKVNNNDITFLSVVDPQTGCSLGSATAVTVQLKNSGVNPIIGGFSVSYTFSGARTGAGVYNATNLDTIQPFSTKNITLPVANMSIGGQYTFNFNVTRAGDENPVDNIFNGHVAHNTLPIDLSSSSMSEDFETSAGLPIGWKVYDLNNDVIVTVRNVFGNQSFAACQGGKSMWFSPTSGSTTQNDIFYTRCVTLVNGSDYALGNFISVSAPWTNAPQMRVGFSTSQSGSTTFDTIKPSFSVTGATCSYTIDTFTWTKPTGTYYLTYHLFGGNDLNSEDLIIDSIALYRLLPCPAPGSFASVAGSNSIANNWVNLSPSRFRRMNFYYGTNISAPSGSTAPNVNSPLNATTYSINNLQPGTTYTIYARSECLAGFGNSTWVGPMTVSTKPSNDDCAGANFIPVTLNTSCTNNVLTKNTGSTPSATGGVISCGIANSGNFDVWYKTVVPGSGRFVVRTSQVTGSFLTDAIVNAYTGTCAGTLTSVGCNDDDAVGGTGHSRLVLTGLTPGDTIRIRVADYDGTATGAFSLCIYDSTARDLGVTSLVLSGGANGNYNLPSTVNLTIKNFGPVTYNGAANVTLSENGTVKASQSFSLSNVPVGGSINVSMTAPWTSTASGALTLKAYTTFGSEINRSNDTTILTVYNNGTTQNASWVNNLSGSAGNENGTTIAYDQNHVVYAAGTFRGTLIIGNDTLKGGNTEEGYLTKYDTLGNPVWTRALTGLGTERITGIDFDNSGNIFIGGQFSTSMKIGSVNLTGLGSSDGFVAKINPAGVVTWARRFGGTGSETVAGLRYSPLTNSVNLGGSFNGTMVIDANNRTSGGDLDIYVAQFDGTTGASIWVYSSPGSQADVLRGITLDLPTGSVYVTGGLCNNKDILGPFGLASAGIYDMFVAKITSAGALAWARSLTGSGSEIGNHVALASNGDVCVLGTFDLGIGARGSIARDLFMSNGSRDLFFAKWNSSGVFQSLKVSGGVGEDFSTSMVNQGSNLLVSGFAQNSSNFFGHIISGSSLGDGFVSSIDSAGNPRFISKTSGTDYEITNGVAASNEGTPYFTGTYKGAATIMNISLTAAGTTNDAFVGRIGSTTTLQGGPQARLSVTPRALETTDESIFPVSTEWYQMGVVFKAGTTSLTWKVAEELTNATFNIEKLMGDHWISVAQVNGNSARQSLNEYAVMVQANEGDLFRVRMNDQHGLFAVSSEVQVAKMAGLNNGKLGGIQVYPNPTKDVCNLNFAQEVKGTVNVSLSSLDGKVVQSWSFENPNQLITLGLNQISCGLYLLKVTSENGELVQKLTIK
jgi:hypothetical protein